MKIEAAAYESGNLVLKTSDSAARRFVFGFKAGEYELVKTKKRRSLDANAYAWVLIDKIAAAVRLPKEEVYQNAIKGIGGVSDIVCVKDAAVDKLRQNWSKNGLGWQTDTMPSKIAGCTNVVLYYGSSAYDTRQMSVFIDRLIDDAKAMDIETLPPERLEAMLSAWHR